MGEEILVLKGRYVVYHIPLNMIEIDTGEGILEIQDVSPSQVMAESVDVELWKSAVKGVIVRIVGSKLYADGERYIIRG